MTDMAPRRMDGFARPQPAGTRPQTAGARPQVPAGGQRPAARPVTPAPQPSVRPMRSAVPPAAQAQSTPAPVEKRGGAWKVVLQFVAGLVVIAVVAAAVVWLYIKYYAQ